MSTGLQSRGDHQGTRKYEIRLQGHLNEKWAAQFAGLDFRHEHDGTTILSGPVIDQAALHGLLRTVRDLALPLIAVNQLDFKAADTPALGTECDEYRSDKER